jgi:hypothetical protein
MAVILKKIVFGYNDSGVNNNGVNRYDNRYGN